MEENCNTMMSAFGIHGDCRIKYEETHPKGENFSGEVTCSGDIQGKDFFWTALYWPASQTADGFVNMVKARLFDMLVEVAKQTGFDGEAF